MSAAHRKTVYAPGILPEAVFCFKGFIAPEADKQGPLVEPLIVKKWLEKPGWHSQMMSTPLPSLLLPGVSVYRAIVL